MIRTIWYLLNLFVLTIWYASKVVGAALLGVENRPGGVYDQTPRRWATKLLRAAGVTVHTVGMEQVPKDEPVIYISNHQSWFDILALAATIPDTVRFVSKKELAKVPLFGWAMRAAGHIFIDRQNRPRAIGAYEETAKVIRAGMSAVVFAEGTRSRTGQLQPFKKGPFVFAIAAQVPVVPVYCAGTFDINPKGSIRIHPRPITLLFGAPIPTAGLDYERRGELLQRAHAVVEQLRVDAGENGR